MPRKKVTIAELTQMIRQHEAEKLNLEREVRTATQAQQYTNRRLVEITDHLNVALRDRAQLITVVALLSRRLSEPTFETDYTPRTLNHYQATDPNARG